MCTLNYVNMNFSYFLEGGEKVDCLYYLTVEPIYVYDYRYLNTNIELIHQSFSVYVIIILRINYKSCYVLK